MSPTPAPTPAEPLAIPACVDLLPLSVAQSMLGANTVALDTWLSPEEVMRGPAAVAAVSSASQVETCAWGIPNSDGGFHVVVAELTPEASSSLITALRGAGTFTEDGGSQRGTDFSRDIPSELGSFGVSYVFFDNAWVTVVGSLSMGSARHVALAAMENVGTANGM